MMTISSTGMLFIVTITYDTVVDYSVDDYSVDDYSVDDYSVDDAVDADVDLS
jgi:hypothetical protein